MGQRDDVVILCPGQGAQAVGMGKAWAESSAAARETLREADSILSGMLPSTLGELCFNGPAETLNRTDVSQPAIFACSVASHRGLVESGCEWSIAASAGLSLGEYTALHLCGVFDFETGLKLVAERGRLMQEAAEATEGGMVALIGADEDQAEALCDKARQGGVLVCANFNAPGQIVLSGDRDCCRRAVEAAAEAGLRATPLQVAGAFHSPHMQQAADDLATALDQIEFAQPRSECWSNVTAQPHDRRDMELLKRRLVEQLVRPVRWAELCSQLVRSKNVGFDAIAQEGPAYHELAPGSVLRGLMRRIDKDTKVTNHDAPE